MQMQNYSRKKMQNYFKLQPPVQRRDPFSVVTFLKSTLNSASFDTHKAHSAKKCL
jgi:hypothetical protein